MNECLLFWVLVGGIFALDTIFITSKLEVEGTCLSKDDPCSLDVAFTKYAGSEKQLRFFLIADGQYNLESYKLPFQIPKTSHFELKGENENVNLFSSTKQYKSSIFQMKRDMGVVVFQHLSLSGRFSFCNDSVAFIDCGTSSATLLLEEIQVRNFDASGKFIIGTIATITLGRTTILSSIISIHFWSTGSGDTLSLDAYTSRNSRTTLISYDISSKVDIFNSTFSSDSKTRRFAHSTDPNGLYINIKSSFSFRNSSFMDPVLKLYHENLFSSETSTSLGKHHVTFIDKILYEHSFFSDANIFSPSHQKCTYILSDAVCTTSSFSVHHCIFSGTSKFSVFKWQAIGEFVFQNNEMRTGGSLQMYLNRGDISIIDNTFVGSYVSFDFEESSIGMTTGTKLSFMRMKFDGCNCLNYCVNMVGLGTAGRNKLYEVEDIKFSGTLVDGSQKFVDTYNPAVLSGVFTFSHFDALSTTFRLECAHISITQSTLTNGCMGVVVLAYGAVDYSGVNFVSSRFHGNKMLVNYRRRETDTGGPNTGVIKKIVVPEMVKRQSPCNGPGNCDFQDNVGFLANELTQPMSVAYGKGKDKKTIATANCVFKSDEFGILSTLKQDCRMRIRTYDYNGVLMQFINGGGQYNFETHPRYAKIWNITFNSSSGSHLDVLSFLPFRNYIDVSYTENETFVIFQIEKFNPNGKSFNGSIDFNVVRLSPIGKMFTNYRQTTGEWIFQLDDCRRYKKKEENGQCINVGEGSKKKNSHLNVILPVVITLTCCAVCAVCIVIGCCVCTCCVYCFGSNPYHIGTGYENQNRHNSHIEVEKMNYNVNPLPDQTFHFDVMNATPVASQEQQRQNGPQNTPLISEQKEENMPLLPPPQENTSFGMNSSEGIIVKTGSINRVYD